MKMFLLTSDNDVLTGMKLAGVDGKIVTDEAEFDRTTEALEKDEDTGILLITHTLGERFADKVLELKKKGRFIVTQIPDTQNPNVESNSITRYVQDAIGIKV